LFAAELCKLQMKDGMHFWIDNSITPVLQKGND